MVDDGLLFDTKISDTQQLALRLKPKIKVNSDRLIEPSDKFSLFDNLKAIPFQAQVITLGLLIVAGLVIIINTIVGAHDQFTPGAQTWFYSHVDSEGEGQSPLMNSLIGSGVLGAAIWLLIKKQLRKYMTFRFKPLPKLLQRLRRYNVSRLVRGKPRVVLKDVRVRIVACNMENGQYKRGSGTDERTVSFTKPVRAVKLFEKRLAHVPAGAQLSNYLNEEVSFDPMFDALYPPQMISNSHGIDVYWEVQLIHDDYVDQEIIGPSTKFLYEEFLHDGDANDEDKTDHKWPRFG